MYVSVQIGFELTELIALLNLFFLREDANYNLERMGKNCEIETEKFKIGAI